VLQVALLYLIYVSILLVSDGWVRRTAYLELPYAYIHSASTIGFTLMAIYTAVFLRQVLSGRDLHYAEAAEQK
jgi:TRAP-type C4-dicarboxylate transport system permease small subunit